MDNAGVCKSSFINKVIKEYSEYDREIQIIARKLSNGDSFLAEELRSEMYIAIMDMEMGHDKAFYLVMARYRAIDYLRSRVRNYSYRSVVKHISLEAMTEAGFQIDTVGKVYAPQNRRLTYTERAADLQ